MATSHAKVPSLLRTVSAMWRMLLKDLADPYRPELHYMRGPGPKWRQKHGLDTVSESAELHGVTQVAA